MATMTVKNAAGDDEVVEKPLAPGRADVANSRPVGLSNEDLAILTDIKTQVEAIAARIGDVNSPREEDPDAAEANLNSLARQSNYGVYLLNPADASRVTYADIIDTNEAPTVMTVTPTTTPYTDAKCIGGLQTMTNFVRNIGSSGLLTRFQLRSMTPITVPSFVHLFRDNPSASTFTNTNTVVLAPADRIKRIKTFSILAADWVSPKGVGGPEYTVELIDPSLGRLMIPYKKINGGRDLYWAWESDGSQGAFAAADDVSYILAAENN